MTAVERLRGGLEREAALEAASRKSIPCLKPGILVLADISELRHKADRQDLQVPVVLIHSVECSSFWKAVCTTIRSTNPINGRKMPRLDCTGDGGLPQLYLRASKVIELPDFAVVRYLATLTPNDAERVIRTYNYYGAIASRLRKVANGIS